MKKTKNKLKLLLIFFSITLVVILFGIPRLPYKTPGNLDDTDYIELDVATGASTGGPEVLNGNDNIKQYGTQMNYKKVNSHEIYLCGDNVPYKVITSGADDGSGNSVRYNKFKIYGEFVKGPDQYGVLTFDVHEWFPLDKNVYVKDSPDWNNYKTGYIIAVSINALIIILLTVISAIKKYLSIK